MNAFEIAVLNEPSVFEPSNSKHFTLSDVETFFLFFRRLLKDTFFSLYEKGGLHNHLQETYPFPIPNIKGFSYLSDHESHKTPTLQPLPV